MSLRDRAVLLTGCTGDIGAAYLDAMTSAGANVVAVDLDDGTELAARASERGPGKAVFQRCDITDDSDVHSAVRAAVERFGGLDAVVNNAAVYRGLGRKRPLEELTLEDWDTVLRVNVRGTWQVIRGALPALRRRGGGRIVNVSSATARMGTAGFAHYVASKAAVEGLTRAAARELGKDGITVNAVSPGLVDDGATRALNDPGYVAAAAGARSLPRDMRPDDLVGALLWLIGPDSGFVSGQTVIVDGGGVFA
ncbi:SDR family NAD(P)-dependent oxidoreductase [Amycolatopsis alkalitolerans]|uniref:SDR family NAD(P)-dependent oxidoreductase n=1 Tax=Amycolatopsis alkalitolerans TaxID=2547244 RepID=UPI00135CB440|nr:SDR family NAD(P)-dependent oxidoreductase [Amycolatopsis alkalitolerans]